MESENNKGLNVIQLSRPRTIRRSSHSQAILKELIEFRQQNLFTDSTVICRGKRYPVHRLILSSCSDYFKEIFEPLQCCHPVIIMNDIEQSNFEMLLNYMYEGKLNVSLEKLFILAKEGQALKIKGLENPNKLFSQCTDSFPTEHSTPEIHIIQNTETKVTNQTKTSDLEQPRETHCQVTVTKLSEKDVLPNKSISKSDAGVVQSLKRKTDDSSFPCKKSKCVNSLEDASQNSKTDSSEGLKQVEELSTALKDSTRCGEEPPLKLEPEEQSCNDPEGKGTSSTDKHLEPQPAEEDEAEDIVIKEEEYLFENIDIDIIERTPLSHADNYEDDTVKIENEELQSPQTGTHEDNRVLSPPPPPCDDDGDSSSGSDYENPNCDTVIQAPHQSSQSDQGECSYIKKGVDSLSAADSPVPLIDLKKSSDSPEVVFVSPLECEAVGEGGNPEVDSEAFESNTHSDNCPDKLFFHLLDVTLLNSYNTYLVNTGENPSFRKFAYNVVHKLLKKYEKAVPKSVQQVEDFPNRLSGKDFAERHFLSLNPKNTTGRTLQRECFVCSNTARRIKRRKMTTMSCKECDKSMCLECFHDFHTLSDY